MGYLAKDDQVFIDGFFVEDVDLRCWGDLAAPLKHIVLAEASRGNKAVNIICRLADASHGVSVQMSEPPRSDVSQLPADITVHRRYTPQCPVLEGELLVLLHATSGDNVRFPDPNYRPEDNEPA